EQPVYFRSADQVIEYLNKAPDKQGQARTKDGVVLITQERGRFRFSVNRGGGKMYYLNSQLRNIVGGEGFVSAGSKMRAEVSEDDARKMIELMLGGAVGGKPVMIEAKAYIPIAKNIVGDTTPTLGDEGPNFELSDDESPASINGKEVTADELAVFN